MSSNNVPSKMEVMGWNPRSLADYMRRLKLSGSDRVVMKGSITGAQFMQMTECDLQVFPSLFVPIITKIQNEINMGEQKKAFGNKSKVQKHPKQVFVQEEEDWNSDEFDSDSDHDYEGPHQEEGEGSYICALTEEQDSDETSEENYRKPFTADIVKPPRHLKVAQPPDGHHRDPVHAPSPVERILKPPNPPRLNHIGPRPFKAPANLPNLQIDRSKKPGQPGPSQKDIRKPKGGTIKALGSFSTKLAKPRTPKPPDVSSRPTPPVPTAPAIPGPRKGLDPSWYGGRLTRYEADMALREVNKDGTFLVRDSSKGSEEHPYTLMLLEQGKVYNIKIRNQGNSYSLGNGLNNKSFPGVKEMITHHTHTPLLLIDATDPSSEAQSQCCLLHPAGL
ncbi:lymphocyte cytosolic protein 2 [Dicentrarchus labrax]|uniref:Lymphocyte cytosolic protein 2b n=1 Tax=Dicentrarchus labrax TaxID=13489 RepID=A0A8P4G1B6_DICLA|nr:lymphocyte cytosolic protein 2 [Dicentrarchus labrax]